MDWLEPPYMLLQQLDKKQNNMELISVTSNMGVWIAQ
jgi:hypothetical protein